MTENLGEQFADEGVAAAAEVPPEGTGLMASVSGLSRDQRIRARDRTVRFHDTGIKDFHHPVVGDIIPTYNRMELPADPGQMLVIWTAEPEPSPQKLSLLGSWAATAQQPEQHEAADHP